jgi:hypothetical protein
MRDRLRGVLQGTQGRTGYLSSAEVGIRAGFCELGPFF